MAELLMRSGLAAFLALSSLVSAEPGPMTALDMLQLDRLASPRLSADGTRLAFLRARSDWEKNRQITDVWLQDADGVQRQLTDTDSTEKYLRFAPSGEALTYIAAGEGDFKTIHLLDIASGESRELTVEFGADVRAYQWRGDGQALYFLADEPLTPQQLQEREAGDDMIRFEVPDSRRHLWRLDIAGEPSVTQVTEGPFQVLGFDLAQDGSKLAFRRGSGTTIDDAHSADIWLLDIASAKQRRLTDNDYAERGVEFSPDGSRLLYRADVDAQGEYYHDANLFVLDIDSGATRPLMLQQSFEVEGATWSADGEQIYIQANMGVRSELWRVDIEQDTALQLTDGEHTVRSWHYHRDSDSHLYSLRSAQSPGDFWRMSGSGEVQQLTAEFDGLSERFRLPQQRLVRWTSYDGTEVEGLLSLPLDYVEGRSYPLVVQTHGGPRSSQQYGQLSWSSYIPVLAARGYAWFSPNYRGSRGYGDAFLQDMVGAYFRNAHLDVLSGIDHLVERGIADPQRLVKKGWSAGGHLTNWLIGYSDRFAAASSGAGVVDWVSMYGVSDVRYAREYWFGGTPWQYDAPLDNYRRHSPLSGLWKASTPTVIFTGASDKRVPTGQSMMLYRALRDLDVPAELYIAPREGHSFNELRHRLFRINKELEWFERHVRGIEYSYQLPPPLEESDG